MKRKWMLFLALVCFLLAGALPAPAAAMTPAGAPGTYISAPESSPHKPPAQSPDVEPVLPDQEAGATAGGPGEALIHAPIAGGIAPTIALNPNAVFAGESISVSGAGVDGYDAVYVTAVHLGQTQNNIRVALADNGTYSTTLKIPLLTPPGPLELCAAVAGAENASYACATLTVKTPAPKRVEGQIVEETGAAWAGAGQAKAVLVDRAGNAVATSPLTGQGQFTFQNVIPGAYMIEFSGESTAPIPGQQFLVWPQDPNNVQVELTVPKSLVCQWYDPYYLGHVKASPSRALKTTTADAVAAIVKVPDPKTLPVPAFTVPPSSMPFGLYVSGVKTPVTFQIEPMADGVVQSLVVRFHNYDGGLVKQYTLTSKPWTVSNFDVGSLQPSKGPDKHPYMEVQVKGTGSDCTLRRRIEVIANPFASFARPGAMWWHSGMKRYKILAKAPNVGATLPLQFYMPPLSYPSVPIIGRLNNEMDAGVETDGWLDLDGTMHIDKASFYAKAYAMGFSLLSGYSKDMVPGSVELKYSSMKWKLVSIYNDSIYGPKKLPFLDVEIPVFGIPGVATIDVIAGAGMEFEVTANVVANAGTAALEAELTPAASLYGYLGAQGNVLMGLNKTGTKATLTGGADLPLGLSTNGPQVNLDACLQANVSVTVYSCWAWGLYCKSHTEPLKKWGPECFGIASMQGTEGGDEPPPQEFLAAPVVAIAPDGSALSAWVENRAAAGATPEVQIVARLRPPDGEWGPLAELSNPLHSAADPTAAFVGPDMTPMVAWSEFKMTAQEAEELGDDPKAHLQQREIVYAFFAGDAWQPPVYVTDDLLPDGIPSLAGGTGGGVLAWTRDLDGDYATRSDQRIAAALLDGSGPGFSPFTTVGSEGLNNEARAAWDQVTGVPWLAWTYDADGDLLTSDDRRIMVASYGRSGWQTVDTSTLPAHADSPAILVKEDVVYLAFLERRASASGTRSVLGSNGMVWTAVYRDGEWVSVQQPENEEEPMLGEAPELLDRGGEVALLFRRWGGALEYGHLGQIAMATFADDAPSHPLALTNDMHPNWLAQAAGNPLDSSVLVVKVPMDLGGFLPGAALGAADSAAADGMASGQGAFAVTPLSTAANSVESLVVNAGADPALDVLALGNAAPQPGEEFTVTVTVRNLGLDAATGMTVRLYSGVAPGGVQIGEQAAPSPLGVNETASLAFSVEGSGSEQNLYAQVFTSGSNLRSDNDRRSVRLNAPAAATVLSVAPSEVWSPAMTVVWDGGESYTAGYRILRAPAAQGPWELVGESSLGIFEDGPVELGRTYCYIVQAYNLDALAEASEPVCAAMPTARTWLPAIWR